MTWVITRLCRDCLDTSCIEVGPVDCIYEYVGPASAQFPNLSAAHRTRAPEPAAPFAADRGKGQDRRQPRRPIVSMRGNAQRRRVAALAHDRPGQVHASPAARRLSGAKVGAIRQRNRWTR
jgi:hypothetical protein